MKHSEKLHCESNNQTVQENFKKNINIFFQHGKVLICVVRTHFNIFLRFVFVCTAVLILTELA